MNLFRTVLVAGAAILGLSSAAIAAERHVMIVNLPSGQVAHIAYAGDVPPVVKLDPLGAVARIPIARIMWADPFAAMDGILAEMRAQHVALLRQAARLAAEANSGSSPTEVGAGPGSLPRGSYSYTFISRSTGNGTCGRVVEITSRPDAAPRQISRSFGDCADSGDPPRAAVVDRSVSRPALPTI